MKLTKIFMAAVLGFTTCFAVAQRSTPVQVLHPASMANDSFGNAVAIDGDTMIVGASLDDVGTNADQGSAHVYRWTGSGWALEAKLNAAGGAAGDNFGSCIAISGDTAIVGAAGDDVGANADQGSAYVFVRAGSAWTQQAQLTAPGGAAGDQFGWSVAVSGDTAIVGAAGDDVGTNVGQGSAYVFTRTGSEWIRQAQLTAPGGAAGDGFGVSVALSGDTAIVGASGDDVGANADQGSASVFVRTGSTWTHQAALTAAGGAAGDLFGFCVAMSGDMAIVGASGVNVGANADQGSAYVFMRKDSAWIQQTPLTAAGGAAGDVFGSCVAISGDTAIVGASGDDVGANIDQGSAYVFVRTGSTWMQQASLAVAGGAGSDQFGVSVALSGNTAIVGANLDDVGENADQGSAWTFSRVGSKWIGPNLSMFAAGGAASDQFGYSVATSGDTAIVGAFVDDVGTNADQGSAYVFVRSGSTWTQQAQLIAAGGAASDRFGYSVAISGDTAIVGVYFDDVGANADQGSAYVFVRSGSTWTQQAQLTAAGGAASDQFGVSVALSGDTAIVGAFVDDVGANANQGSAYVFVRSGSTWTQQAQLTATGGAASDQFGWSVGLSGDMAIVGANLDDVGANANQGSAYVFVRSGSTWTQQAQLTASGGAASDQFGVSIALSGETAIVGANLDDVGANADQGSAYVFRRTGSTWSQQAQLTAADGAASDQFGWSVALSGDTAIVGAFADDVGANANQGSAYVFVRSGSTWTQQAQLTATGAAADDRFGYGVALSGDTAIVGAYLDNVGANADQGSAWTFDVAAHDFPLAHNDVTNVPAPSLAGAMLSAASGQQITASEGAWRTIGSVNTVGRSLSLRGLTDIRTPPSSSLELGGSSVLDAVNAVEIFGQLRVSSGSSVDLAASSFRLGSRGILTARTNASLSINAPTASVDGQTRVEQAASLTAAGDWTNIGPVALSQGASFTAGGILRNIDTWTMSAGSRVSAGLLIDNLATWTFTAGELYTLAFNNRQALNTFGVSAIFGSLYNNAGATTAIRSGTLFVFGDLTNNGTVIGTICSTCSGLPPSMDVGGTLSLGPAANLTMPFVGSVVHLGGSFDCAINATTRFDMAQATLLMESARPEVTLEVMSRDIGVDALGLDRSRPGHFPIGELHIGGSPTTVRLVDAHDNALDGTGACEALYVDTLRIDAGSRLINTTCRIYYNTLINGGTVDVPTNLIPLQGTPCPADFNMDGGVDGGDVVDFFAAWEGGDSMADVNQDGGVDGGDIDVFFAAWEAGGC